MAKIEAARHPRDWRQAVPTEAEPAPEAPRRHPAARHLRAVPPGSLAASVVAAGLENVDLGIERLSRPRQAGRGPVLLLLGLAISILAAAAMLWQPAAPTASTTSADQPAPSSAAAAGGGARNPVSGATGAASTDLAVPPRDVASTARLTTNAAGAGSSSTPDIETLRTTAVPAPVAETVPGPGGLAFSIRAVESNYTVAPGDTLERIAQRYSTTVDAIVGMNNLRDRHSLQVGQKLIIP
jgi:LysM repeat protein